MQYPIYNLGITKKTTRLDVLRKRHYNYTEEWDKLIFTFICGFIKRNGFFEWSEWSLYSQQGFGDIFSIESLLPIAGAHIPLPKVVKAEEISSRCKYCGKLVCRSNCEQEIKNFNKPIKPYELRRDDTVIIGRMDDDLVGSTIREIAQETGIPEERLLGTTHG